MRHPIGSLPKFDLRFWFSQERGSIAPLGIFAIVFLLAAVAVTTESRQLFIEQRSVNTISDALALDLADLARVSGSASIATQVEAELKALSPSPASLALERLYVREVGSATTVEVTLCNSHKGIFTFSHWTPTDAPDQVCATSRAVSSLDQ